MKGANARKAETEPVVCERRADEQALLIVRDGVRCAAAEAAQRHRSIDLEILEIGIARIDEDRAADRVAPEHGALRPLQNFDARDHRGIESERSEEHTSELQSLMRISYAVFCLKKKQTH